MRRALKRNEPRLLVSCLIKCDIFVIINDALKLQLYAIFDHFVVVSNCMGVIQRNTPNSGQTGFVSYWNGTTRHLSVYNSASLNVNGKKKLYNYNGLVIFKNVFQAFLNNYGLGDSCIRLRNESVSDCSTASCDESFFSPLISPDNIFKVDSVYAPSPRLYTL